MSIHDMTLHEFCAAIDGARIRHLKRLSSGRYVANVHHADGIASNVFGVSFTDTLYRALECISAHKV